MTYDKDLEQLLIRLSVHKFLQHADLKYPLVCNIIKYSLIGCGIKLNQPT